jgi:hypothetical protein
MHCVTTMAAHGLYSSMAVASSAAAEPASAWRKLHGRLFWLTGSIDRSRTLLKCKRQAGSSYIARRWSSSRLAHGTEGDQSGCYYSYRPTYVVGLVARTSQVPASACAPHRAALDVSAVTRIGGYMVVLWSISQKFISTCAHMVAS